MHRLLPIGGRRGDTSYLRRKRRTVGAISLCGGFRGTPSPSPISVAAGRRQGKRHLVHAGYCARKRRCRRVTRLAPTTLINEIATRGLFFGGDAEQVSGQNFNLFFILTGESPMRLACGLRRGRLGTASFDLLAMEQIIEVHGVRLRLVRRRDVATAA